MWRKARQSLNLRLFSHTKLCNIFYSERENDSIANIVNIKEKESLPSATQYLFK
jgi:hypothetical protein